MRKSIFILLIFGSFYCSSQSWTYYNIINTSKDQGASNIVKLIIDSIGNPWMVNKFGGVTYFDGNDFYNYTKANGLAEEQYVDATIDANNNIYFLSYNYISIYRNQNFSHIKLNNNINPSKIAVDKMGKIYLVDQIRLFILDSNRLDTFNIKDILGQSINFGIRSVDIDQFDRVWLATNFGLIQYKSGALEVINISDGLVSNNISQVKCDKDSVIYFAYDSHGFGSINGSNIYRLSLGNDSTDFSNRYFDINPDHTISFINKKYGYFIYNLSNAVLTEFKHPLINSFNYGSIARGKYGDYWISTNKGLLHFKDGVFKQYTKKTGLASNSIRSIYFDEFQDVFIGTNDGLAKFKDKEWTYICPLNIIDILDKSNNNLLCTSLDSGAYNINLSSPYERVKLKEIKYSTRRKNAKDSSGNFWIPTTINTVIKFNGLTATEYLLDQSVGKAIVRNIALNPKDNLPYLATSIGVYKFDGLKFSRVLGTEGFLCYDIAFTSEGKMILFATPNVFSIVAIYYFDGNNLLQLSNFDSTIKNFLPDGYYLFIDSKDQIWFGCHLGMFHFDGNVWYLYDLNNGLLSNQVNCINEDSSHNMWIGTESGVCKLTLGTVKNENINFNNPITPYPNPCLNYIEFTFPEKIIESMSNLQIFNESGSLVIIIHKLDSRKLNIQFLKNGKYYFKINDENMCYTGSFVKL